MGAKQAPTGEDAWFTQVASEHSRALVRFFARRGPVQDAEDLAADVLLTAWRRREDVPREAVLPWLYRTAGYVLANHRRKMRDIPTEDLPEPDSPRRVGTDPEISAVFDDDVRRALEAVGERNRQILLLHAWEGLDGEELGQVLGISRSGAQAALSRARAKLRSVWPVEATTPPGGLAMQDPARPGHVHE